ncbi:hypothetical protein KJA13_00895 [Patescibacteria group bacterium]|nr:hypothetical protein [Patescibacteria group bacterium]
MYRLIFGMILLFSAVGVAATGNEVGRCLLVALLAAVGTAFVPGQILIIFKTKHD